MSAGRVGEPGRTRVCPHCKSTILDSADVCPACRHHLRFGVAPRADERAGPSVFRLEGSFANDSKAETWEYSLVVALYDERGAELARKIVHVGALRPADSRRCLVSLDVQPAVLAAAGSSVTAVSRPLPSPLPAGPPARPGRIRPTPPSKPRGPA